MARNRRPVYSAAELPGILRAGKGFFNAFTEPLCIVCIGMAVGIRIGLTQPGELVPAAGFRQEGKKKQQTFRFHGSGNKFQPKIPAAFRQKGQDLILQAEVKIIAVCKGREGHQKKLFVIHRFQQRDELIGAGNSLYLKQDDPSLHPRARFLPKKRAHFVHGRTVSKKNVIRLHSLCLPFCMLMQNQHSRADETEYKLRVV